MLISNNVKQARNNPEVSNFSRKTMGATSRLAGVGTSGPGECQGRMDVDPRVIPVSLEGLSLLFFFTRTACRIYLIYSLNARGAALLATS